MSLLDRLDLGAGGPSALSDTTFLELRQYIYDRTGIYFRDNKRYLLESRLQRRLTALGMPDFEAYLRHLRTGLGAREFTELANAVTINETYFFRHPEQHRLFVREVLPDLIDRRLAQGQRCVRLWSVACSTGDEPYTLAMLIREEVAARYPQVRFEIIGTDINTEVIDRARAGLYEPYAIRNVPPDLLCRYFDEEAGPHGPRYRLAESVRRMVRFEHLNLANRLAARHLTDVDAAFCANVLIYFDDRSKQAAASVLYGALRPGGYLFLGASETLYGITQAFHPVRFAQTVAYHKPELASPAGRSLAAQALAAGVPVSSPSPTASREPRYV